MWKTPLASRVRNPHSGRASAVPAVRCARPPSRSRTRRGLYRLRRMARPSDARGLYPGRGGAGARYPREPGARSGREDTPASHARRSGCPRTPGASLCVAARAWRLTRWPTRVGRHAERLVALNHRWFAYITAARGERDDALSGVIGIRSRRSARYRDSEAGTESAWGGQARDGMEALARP